MAIYTIFAGVNGAGKTSIYRSIYYERDIERRYYESLNNLKKILGICNEINIYYNTNEFKYAAYICNGTVKWKRNTIINWSRKILQ